MRGSSCCIYQAHRFSPYPRSFLSVVKTTSSFSCSSCLKLRCFPISGGVSLSFDNSRPILDRKTATYPGGTSATSYVWLQIDPDWCSIHRLQCIKLRSPVTTASYECLSILVKFMNIVFRLGSNYYREAMVFIHCHYYADFSSLTFVISFLLTINALVFIR